MGRNPYIALMAGTLCAAALTVPARAQDDEPSYATDAWDSPDEQLAWQPPSPTPPAPTELQPSIVDGSTATTETPRPRTNPSRRSSSASQYALGGGASAVSRRQANTPYMIGDLFGASLYQLSVQGAEYKTTAVYFDAALDSDFLSTFANFDHPGGGGGGLPIVNGLPAPFANAFDSSGDGEPDVFPNVPQPGGLTTVVLNAQGQPGTLVFLSGAGYLVRQQISTPPGTFLNPQTAINSSARSPVDGDAGVPGLATAYDLQYEYMFRPDAVIVNVPSPGGGGAVGRVKIAENDSPIPRDRVFFNYSLFHNVPFNSSDPDVNRYTPGFEKTFWNGRGSVELTAPFASTLDSNLTAGEITNGSNTEFGNASVILKLLLWSNDNWAFAGGLGVSVPTADDVVVSLADGRPLIAIDNDAFHLQPFLGLLWTPSDRFFAQGFTQLDVDIDGNPVWADLQGLGLERFGRLNDSTLMIADLGVGYWIHRSNSGKVTGLAPVWELHYNRSLEDQDVLQRGNLVLGNANQDVDVLNTTIGLNVELFNYALMTVGYTAPLSDATDRQFDGEFRVMCNIGPRPTRAARAQF
ncbi:MAG: hypothetical protein SGJ19_20620 [Planctomycetia bacterium]|nr:hypothetical protein [Planctomycetia bacterium]